MLTESDKADLERINDYWFDHLEPRQWFITSAALDRAIRDRFLPAHQRLKDLDLPALDLSGPQILAAILLFDQMPRNMFRNSARAFDTDPLARALCAQALARKYDLAMDDLRRSFIYMPLEHSEDLQDQELCVSLFQQRTQLDEQIDYAVRHHVIIKKFGRFPHRNKLLGRVSTAEEQAFLAGGGETFGVEKAPGDS